MTNILLNMLGAATAAILLGTFHAVWLEWKRELAATYDEWSQRSRANANRNASSAIS